MQMYQLKTTDGDTVRWAGSSGPQAVDNAEEALDVKVTAWRTEWQEVLP